MAARKDWLGYTAKQEQEIVLLYERAGEALRDQIRRDTKADVILKARRKALMHEIDAELNRLRTSLAYKIRAAMSQSVDAGIGSGIIGGTKAGIRGSIQIGSSFLGADGKVRHYDAKVTTYTASPWARINREAMEALLRYRPTGLTFSESIWDATWDVQKRMRFMVNQAVLLGTSSQNLARELKQYVTAKGIQTSPGVYKSAYANAWRLARTEMNRAYTEGQVRYASKKSWIDGVIWRLGNTDACPICRGLSNGSAGQFYAKDNVPERPHPNCTCWLEWHIADEQGAAAA